MNSRDGFPQTGADEVRISPSSGAADRAAQAYEKAFLESAHSNESKLRLLEERMKRPQSTAQMSDAVRAGAPEPHSDDDDDDDEQRDEHKQPPDGEEAATVENPVRSG